MRALLNISTLEKPLRHLNHMYGFAEYTCYKNSLNVTVVCDFVCDESASLDFAWEHGMKYCL